MAAGLENIFNRIDKLLILMSKYKEKMIILEY
jgi:hypothetical protein